MQRIRAREMLEQIAVIGLAMTGDPRGIGRLRIAAGEDAKDVSRWVVLEEMKRRKKPAGGK